VRADMVGFVFQSFQLLSSLTALDNVALPMELSGTQGAREKAQKYLQKVGLEKRLGHYPKQLSGGEQQRVALARAFACQPKILFADEPTWAIKSWLILFKKESSMPPFCGVIGAVASLI